LINFEHVVQLIGNTAKTANVNYC